VQSPLVIPDDQGRSTYYGWGSISPPTILAELFPEQTAETPDAAGCGCSSAPGLASGVASVFLALLGLAGAVLRRRSV
jgi:MYXO-CTERM domain-containing protein